MNRRAALLTALSISLPLGGCGNGAPRSSDAGAPATSASSPPVASASGSAASSASAMPSASAAPSAAASADAPPPVIDTSDDELPLTVKEQREQMYARMTRELELPAEKLAAVRAVIDPNPIISQGNPRVAKHPMKRSECKKARVEAKLPITAESHAPCAQKNMVPVYDPGAGQTANDAKVCIDQFEFPDVACDYPLVHVSAREAGLLCQAMGKRICDAHEWEGACAGAIHSVESEYFFDRPRMQSTYQHNKEREIVWSYGKTKNHMLCAMGSTKTKGCEGGGWKECGSNTYPAGAFPACSSPFGAWDLHGNAAEHMNLPLNAEELESRGGSGQTEMKGSWFVFQQGEAHPDDCRWRAPDWHPSKLMDPASHSNYHLSFRCCADVAETK